MHRTEGNNNLLNLFANGPPGTVVEQEWLNAVQEEIAYVIEQAGITLKTALSETRTQLKQALDVLYKTSIPVGAIFTFPVSIVPSGYLELDGSAKSKVTYPELYAFLKDGGATCIYGEAGGNFTLPDFRGRFLRGWDHGAGLDPNAAARTDRGDGTGGDVVGTKQADAFKSHEHALLYENTGSAGGALVTVLETSASPGILANKALATGGNETRPVNINVLWCIKY
jgi:phage-related tail fiber protein